MPYALPKFTFRCYFCATDFPTIKAAKTRGSLCPQSFSDNGHRSVQLGLAEQTYTCRICNRKFATMQGLSALQARSHQQRDVVVSVSARGSEATVNSNMDANNDNLRCQFCDTLFCHRTCLNIHAARYHSQPLADGYLLECGICHWSFTTRSGLTRRQRPHWVTSPDSAVHLTVYTSMLTNGQALRET